MAKLFFYYSVMNSGKTLELIRSAYNYSERGMKALVIKPAISSREEKDDELYSRTGMKYPCVSITEKTLLFSIKDIYNYHVIFVDEAQFLTPSQVEQLSDIKIFHKIPVLAYGLKNDFRTKLFPGSQRLLELADEIHEIKSICSCGARASQSARIINGEMVLDGEQVSIGAEESYTTYCNDCYRRKQLQSQSSKAFQKEYDCEWHELPENKLNKN